jgi:lysine decarboxylase
MGSNRPAWLDDAPLFAAWQRFVEADAAPFTIPGHKRRGQALNPALGRLLDADVPLYGGADTVKLTAGVLAEAERRAADLWGADLCHFTTGGSTQANQVLTLALGQPGDVVLVARNAHRSVFSGLVLAGLRPVWLPVRVDAGTGAPLGLDLSTVEQALVQNPDAVALLCTEPSYLGTASEHLPAIVAAAHRHGVPVVVDAAWGAHLGFAPGYPAHALQQGADAMVTSAHKMLPAFSQAAVVLIRTTGLDADRVRRAVAAVETTSPSAAILASIDAARAFLCSDEGRVALGRTAALVQTARERLTASGLCVPGPGDYGATHVDPAKLVIQFAAAGRSGLAAEKALLAAGVPVEMADRDTVVAQVGLTDDASTMDRLVTGITRALAHSSAGPARTISASVGPAPTVAMTPREAYFAEFETVDARDALGRVSAELIAPYPPGVPILAPGEEVTPEVLGALYTSRDAGNRIAYAADPALHTLQVVART